MSNGPLQISCRPDNFDDFVGNKAVISSLKNTLSKPFDKMPKCLLFHGFSGCGKTTLVRIVSNELDIHESDFMEINAAQNRGINEMRQILESAPYSPLHGKAKMYMFDEAHMLTTEAQNSLLKFLEEPPAHVIITLCTTEPGKLLKTIRTRSTPFLVKKQTLPVISRLLVWAAKKNNLQIKKSILRKVASVADGCPRQALVILDNIYAMTNEEEILELIETYSEIGELLTASTLELCRAFLEQSKWNDVRKILNNIEGEPENIRYGILAYMTKVLLGGDDPMAAAVIEQCRTSYMYTKKAGLVYDSYMITTLGEE